MGIVFMSLYLIIAAIVLTFVYYNCYNYDGRQCGIISVLLILPWVFFTESILEKTPNFFYFIIFLNSVFFYFLGLFFGYLYKKIVKIFYDFFKFVIRN